ncbi:MAG: AAA family ATPase [Planctomycetes bacterium]|nr:AAA family ATPase [Planctomycetota bacterium]
MLIRELRLKNLLSFGPEGLSLPLQDLNIIIGPNGSGKSNLIEAISLLQAAPTSLATPVREGGGIRDWLWKGKPHPIASIVAVVDYPEGEMQLHHLMSFTETMQRFELVKERIADGKPGRLGSDFYYRYEDGLPSLRVKGMERSFLGETLDPQQSILSQRKDPDQYPEITYLGTEYAKIRIYRDWSFGRRTPPRLPQRADQRNDRLEENFENLGLVLNRLRRDAKVKKTILDWLTQVYDGIDDYDVSIEGGTVQVFLHEGGFSIPATRLSDGTLRYLCLLAILCDPNPPPLICIEEPELGFHPDVLPGLARLLKEAARRTQLIVTTHSDILVDEMTDQPDAVVVCEKRNQATEMKRLDKKELECWLEKYRLGELWTKGEIGGTRW